MPNSAQTKLSKALFRELPYNGQNIRQCHGSFNNLMPIENLPSKKYLDRLPSLNDIDLFSLNADNVNNGDLEYSSIRPVRCKYYSPHSFSLLTNKLNKQVFRSQLTLFHNNVCSLKSNLENLQTHLLNELDFHFNIIGVRKTQLKAEKHRAVDKNILFQDSVYLFSFKRSNCVRAAYCLYLLLRPVNSFSRLVSEDGNTRYIFSAPFQTI